jgi:hypothetical protein
MKDINNHCIVLVIAFLAMYLGISNLVARDLIQPAALMSAEASMIAGEQSVLDSIAIVRTKEIMQEFGFSDSYRLSEVADRLKIGDVKRWKTFLGLEPENSKLDSRSLRQLGITPLQAVLAQESTIYGFNELNTVSELSKALTIPSKYLKQKMGIDPLDRSVDNSSIQALDFSVDQINQIKLTFDKEKMALGGSITFVGLLVVFSALILTSIIIGKLQHFNAKQPKTKPIPTIKISKSGTVISSPRTMSQNVIVAAITALHIHNQTIEERKKLLLTFKRTPINLWHASNVINMPNREYMRRRS